MAGYGDGGYYGKLSTRGKTKGKMTKASQSALVRSIKKYGKTITKPEIKKILTDVMANPKRQHRRGIFKEYNIPVPPRRRNPRKPRTVGKKKIFRSVAALFKHFKTLAAYKRVKSPEAKEKAFAKYLVKYNKTHPKLGGMIAGEGSFYV
jgi:hypothetical protein